VTDRAGPLAILASALLGGLEGLISGFFLALAAVALLDGNPWLIAVGFVVGLLPVALVSVGLWRARPGERARRLVQAAVFGLSALIFGGVLLNLAFSGSRASPERIASSSLKTIASAQMDFRSNDRDGNGVMDYWTRDVAGLHDFTPAGGQPMKLVEPSIAAADATASGEPAPKGGYHFRAMTTGPDGPYDGGSGRHPSCWAVCAYPRKHAKTGKFTFIVNEEGTIWRKDTSGPVLAWPADLQGEGWSKLD